jgi:hypothetical protein
MKYFEQVYDASRDKFLQRVQIILYAQDTLDGLLKPARQRRGLSNLDYSLMKDWAKKFISRIKEGFPLDIVAAIKTKTPLQDAETLLAYSTKLTYRWAAGIIVSNHIATLLIKLSRFRTGEKHTDDITTLYANLKNRTTNRKFKTFLIRSYRRFEDADKLRNRCAHVIEGEPTKHEIDQSITLARLLQTYMARK